jgi:outer membrane protein insertion porin family
MKKQLTNSTSIFFFTVSLLVLMSACSTTKSVPKNDKLYTGASVSVEGPDLSARQKKTLRNDLKGLTRPKPNSRLLGIPFRLGFYNLFSGAKPGSFFGKLRDKWGEPPVLLSQLDLQRNTKNLQNYLENKGFFHARVSGDTTVKGRKASASYNAQTGNQYTIAAVQFPQDSSDLAKAIAAASPNTLLKPGQPFDLDVIKGERIRIDAYLKEHGFYFFSPEYLLIRTDSTIGNNKVNLYVVVKEDVGEDARQVYRINNVYIYGNYNLATAVEDTNQADRKFVRGYYVIDKENRYKPRLFVESMQFQTGDVYNRTEHNQTLNRLINLNLFKFVKNRFEVAQTDSPRLDAYYYLTSMPTRTLRGEITAISRSNNLNGSQITFSWLNRNLFRNGTNFVLSAYVGSDIQFSGALRGYNTYRTGAQASLSFPRFFGPFLKRSSRGPFAPRTNINLGYDILNRKGLYTLNSYRFEYAYNWRKNLQTEQQFSPIAITYVQPLNVTQAYDSLKGQFRGLENAIRKQFILGAMYRYTYNELVNGQQTNNAYYFSGLVDVSGNIAGLISGANVKRGDTARLFGTLFSQYVKLEADLRRYTRVGIRSTWVNRINVGFGLPYGNSVDLPYVKQFFIGGNNSLRGFRSRAVGPGTFFSGDERNLADQTGDIKLEVNTEFRPHISGPIYGAVFLEAGNIWLFNDSTYTRKPGGKFTGQFLKQMAVSTGVGIRLDVQLFVIRLDLGIPLKKPWETEWNRIRFGDAAWRSNNLVYNLAIGYPF